MCGIFFAVDFLMRARQFRRTSATSAEVVDLEINDFKQMYTETSDALISKSPVFEMSAR